MAEAKQRKPRIEKQRIFVSKEDAQLSLGHMLQDVNYNAKGVGARGNASVKGSGFRLTPLIRKAIIMPRTARQSKEAADFIRILERAPKEYNELARAATQGGRLKKAKAKINQVQPLEVSISKKRIVPNYYTRRQQLSDEDRIAFVNKMKDAKKKKAENKNKPIFAIEK